MRRGPSGVFREPIVSEAAPRPGGRRASKERDAARKVDREIDRLQADIQKFRIDAQRFFAGDLPLPPYEQRDRIQADLRRLRSANLKGAAANFRLGSLEARFNSHLDLFGRRLREREDKGEQRPTKELRPDPEKGIVIGRKSDPAAVAALHNGLYPGGGVSLERFGDYLDRQAKAIRAKTGCADIQFRIAVQDGKAKLKAKPIRRGGT